MGSYRQDIGTVGLPVRRLEAIIIYISAPEIYSKNKFAGSAGGPIGEGDNDDRSNGLSCIVFG
jgi:hypothetical protein